jgi:hypothetical protein
MQAEILYQAAITFLGKLTTIDRLALRGSGSRNCRSVMPKK